jgi:predicted nucleotidyltransferase
MDTEKLLLLLKDHKVDFIIIGATAFPVYGYVRATVDIDIFIRPEKKNAENTLNALKKFGYDMSDVTVDNLLNNKILIRQYIVETDIHPFVKGVDFEGAWSRKVESEFGSTRVYFASLDDLIEMKKAAGRVQDLEDLKYLNKIKNQRHKKS